MTTLAYVGRPGSGKSYAVVENQIMPALKAGIKVVTNIPMIMDEVRKVVPGADVVEFPIDTVAAEPHKIYDYVTHGCLFVIDEVWKIWPSGQKVNDVPEPYKRLLKEHRHMVDVFGRAINIVLVTQDLGDIGAFAVRMIDETFVHTKMSTLGASGSFRVDIYEGPVKGPQYPVNSRVRFIGPLQYKADVYKFYKSHTMSESTKLGAIETGMDRRNIIWKRPIFIVGALAIPCLLWFGFHTLHSVIDKAKGKPAASAQSAPTAGPTSVVSRPFDAIANPIRAAIDSGDWRVVGVVKNLDHPEKSLAVLRPKAGSPVFVPFAKCQEVIDQSVRCPIDGIFYDEFGKASTDVPRGPTGEWHLPSAPVAAPATNLSGSPAIALAKPG